MAIKHSTFRLCVGGHSCNKIMNKKLINAYILLVTCDTRIAYEVHYEFVCLPSDINECLHNNGGCDMLCVNLVGDYKCECGYGFQLEADSKTKCVGEWADRSMLLFFFHLFICSR